MQMLWAGGMPCKGDPPAFECFSLGAIPWGECEGHAVKLVDSHLQLPPDGDYLVIRLRRDAKEQAKSFNKWNAAFGLPGVALSQLIGSFRRDYKKIDAWSRSQRGWMCLDFEKIIEFPRPTAVRLADFLGRDLDLDRMKSVVENRDVNCLPSLLELELIKKYDTLSTGWKE